MKSDDQKLSGEKIKLLKFLVAESIDMCFLISGEGTIIQVSQPWCQALDYTPAECIGEWFGTFVAPESMAGFQRILGRTGGGVSPVNEISLLSNSRATVRFKFNYRIGYNADGDIELITGFLEKTSDSAPRIRAQKQTVAMDRLLWDSIEEMVFLFTLRVDDIAGEIIDANITACRKLRYTRDEIIGLNISELYDPELKPRVKTLIAELKGKKHLNTEFYLRTKNGSDLPVEANVMLIDLAGRPAAIAIMRDRTQQHIADLAAQATGERVIKTFHDSPDAMLLIRGKDQTIKDINSVFIGEWGYQNSETVGRSMGDIGLWNSEDQHVRFLQDMKKYNGVQSFKTDLRRMDGTIVDCQLNGQIVKIDNEDCMVLVLKDSSFSRDAERLLLRSMSRFHGILAAMVDMIFAFDKDGRFIFFHAPSEDDLILPPSEFMGKHVRDVMPRDVSREFENSRMKNLDGSVCTFEYSIDMHNVTRSFSVKMSPINLDNEYDGSVAVVRDITDVRRASEEKQEIQERLYQSQRMEAVGSLAGGIAHDFNNLLTVIQGHTQLAMLDVDESDPLYVELKQIHKAAVQAANLTRQLLVFSRKQTIEFAPFNVNKTLETLIKMIRRLIGEHIDISLDLSSHLWSVLGDETKIEQVIVNLAVNARDAMPDGGHLKMITRNMVLTESESKRHPVAKAGQFVEITIIDNGVGINQETLEKIFDPFFTTKPAGKGTGLGLSVVYGVVKQHGGWIRVESEPGLGSIFSIFLPASEVAPEDLKPLRISASELQGAGEQLLVVEDEDDVRAYLQQILTRSGYKVTAAMNIQQALSIFENEARKFDLVFSDIILPDGSGVEFVEQILDRSPATKILLGSGYPADQIQWDRIQAKHHAYVQKPYVLGDLLLAIKDLLTG